MAMGQAGGLEAAPDKVLKIALTYFKQLPSEQRPNREPRHSDVPDTLNEFKNGRLLSLLPLAGIVSGLEGTATSAELKAASQFVKSCRGSFDRALKILQALAAAQG
jgi:hypothetical protein